MIYMILFGVALVLVAVVFFILSMCFITSSLSDKNVSNFFIGLGLLVIAIGFASGAIWVWGL